MVQSVIQTSFHAGEWAPALNARVDLAKYKSGAALLRNFFVDYRGGASSRAGTRFVTQCYDSGHIVRLIPFQASNSVGYILEFGNFYMRVIANAALVAFGPLPTPYADFDLALLKFTQSVDKLIICHPNYPPYILTLITATNWTLNPIVFGANVPPPSVTSITTTNAGSGFYGYVVTAIDGNGQESPNTNVNYSNVNIASGQISTVNIVWTAVTGAVVYNVYRTAEAHNANPPTGSALGLISTVTGTSISDTFYSNQPQLPADFSLSPPIAKNPFTGGGVDHVVITAPGNYTSVPTATFGPPGAGGLNATGQPILGAWATAGIVSSDPGFSVGDIIYVRFTPGITDASITLQVTVTGGGGVVTGVVIVNGGSIGTPGAGTPANPVIFGDTPSGTTHRGIQINLVWGVTSFVMYQSGYGYSSAPSIFFSGGGGATANAVLQSSTGGNPAVPGIFQQRLVLAAKPLAVQSFDMSQPGSYYNFNVSNPVQADDAITASLASGQLNEIKSMVSVPTGLVLLTSKSNWLVSSGSGNAAVTPIDIAAHTHSYNGASDLPPIIANFDILFVQAKNSIVRDLTFNFYTQIYTGTDISILSSHLFYGYTINEWAWSEEPFKMVWAVRNDGTMLTLTYLKEQDLIGWTHHDTQGTFQSVATITEVVGFTNAIGPADMVYVVVERVINGNTVKYIERFNQRAFFDDAVDAWCVDAGLKYVGPPATNFSGADHLAGATVTGVADGVVIPPFVMPLSGSFTLPTPASKVIVGLSYVCQLQTLRLDTGDPTIQGKRKGINGVTVRVEQTLGLTIGKDFDKMVVMKDLVKGNVGSQSNSVVTQLVTDDVRTIIDPSWDVPGQYCIQQNFPLPATILGVIPEIEIGDTK